MDCLPQRRRTRAWTKEASLSLVRHDLRQWTRGDLTHFVDGEAVLSLAPEAITVELVHDWAFGMMDDGVVGEDGDASAAVQDWLGWKRLLVNEYGLRAWQWAVYEDLVRRRVTEQAEGDARRQGRLQPPGAVVAGGGGGAVVSALFEIPVDVFVKVREHLDRPSDFNQLLRVSRAVRQRLLSEGRLWDEAVFQIKAYKWEAVETVVRRADRQLRTLVLPDSIRLANQNEALNFERRVEAVSLPQEYIGQLKQLVEEGYLDQLQRLDIPNGFWASVLAVLIQPRFTQLETLVCQSTLFRDFGLLVYVAKVELSLVRSSQHLELKELWTDSTFIAPHSLSFPQLERLDLTDTVNNLCWSGPQLRVLTIRNMGVEKGVEKVLDGLWRGRVVVTPCAQLGYVSISGMWFRYSGEAPLPSSSDIVEAILGAVHRGDMPSLRCVALCVDELDFTSFGAFSRRDGWSFHAGTQRDLLARGLLRPPPHVVPPDAAVETSPAWRRSTGINAANEGFADPLINAARHSNELQEAFRLRPRPALSRGIIVAMRDDDNDEAVQGLLEEEEMVKQEDGDEGVLFLPWSKRVCCCLKAERVGEVEGIKAGRCF